MTELVSAGEWMRRRRDQLGLTRSQLAHQVGCSADMVKKIERDERRPSQQIAQLLATHLQIPDSQTEDFIHMVRGVYVPRMPAPADVMAAHSAEIAKPSIVVAAMPNGAATPFVGREAEVAAVADMLHHEDVRFVTLLASGGMGKTRLAMHLGQKLQGRYADGVAFVQLVAAQQVDNAIAEIARAIQLTLKDGVAPRQQLFDALAEAHMLLVLDNLEHLLSAEMRDFLVELLEATTHLQLLVTSREKVLLQAETVFPVSGLAMNEGESNSAVALFLSCAPLAHIDDDDLQTIAAICKLIEGMPLAIEMAAALTDTLPIDEILAEVSHNIRVLSTDTHDVADRHQSIRAVYDPSWQRLDPALRQIVMRFAVFRGGASLEAVRQVTGASPAQLQQLIHRTFLRLADGRYRMHELLRQYAELKLIQATEAAAARERHAHYYTDLLVRESGDQPIELINQRLSAEAQAVLQEDVDNLVTAWRWWHDTADREQLIRITTPLYLMFKAEKRLREMLPMLKATRAAVAFDPARPLPHLRWALLTADLFVVLGFSHPATLTTLFEVAELAGEPIPITSRGLKWKLLRLWPHFVFSMHFPKRTHVHSAETLEVDMILTQMYAMFGLVTYVEEDSLSFLYALGKAREKLGRVGHLTPSILAIFHGAFFILFNMLSWSRRANQHEREARQLLQELPQSAATLLAYLALITGSPGHRGTELIAQDFDAVINGEVAYQRMHSRIYAEVIGGQRLLFFLYQGRFETAINACLETIAYADGNYVYYYSTLERGILATCYRILGDLDKAQTTLEQADGLAPVGNLGRATFWGYSEWLMIHVANGRMADARRQLDNLLPFLADVPFTLFYLQAYVNSVEGALALLRHDAQPDATLVEMVERTLVLLKRLSMVHVIAKPDACLQLGRYEALCGRPHKARELWECGLSWAQKLSMPYQTIRLQDALGASETQL